MFSSCYGPPASTWGIFLFVWDFESTGYIAVVSKARSVGAFNYPNDEITSSAVIRTTRNNKKGRVTIAYIKGKIDNYDKVYVECTRSG